LRLESDGAVRYEADTVNGTLFVSPEEVGASILRTLRKTAEQRLDVPVRKIVMAVPAEFDVTQRNATKQAAHLAGRSRNVCLISDVQDLNTVLLLLIRHSPNE